MTIDSIRYKLRGVSVLGAATRVFYHLGCVEIRNHADTYIKATIYLLSIA
jgi:hypothetical protein